MKKIVCLFMALMMLFAASCSRKSNVNDKKDAETSKSETVKDTGSNTKESTIKVKLYFADSAGRCLVPEEREVKDDGLSEEAVVVSELIRGTDNKELVSLIPEGTKLISVKREGNLCTVDLSSEFVGASNGATESTLCLYSLVNSLTSIDGIDEVQFLIDGEKQEIFGSLIFDEPFTADESYNKK